MVAFAIGAAAVGPAGLVGGAGDLDFRGVEVGDVFGEVEAEAVVGDVDGGDVKGVPSENDKRWRPSAGFPQPRTVWPM